MTRTITITIIALAVLAFFWASASTASAGYIDNLTLDDISGPKMTEDFRNGIIAGIFHSLTASKAITCPFMSPRMLVSGLKTARSAKEIDGNWTVYHASLYVLVRAGCAATTDKKEQTNA